MLSPLLSEHRSPSWKLLLLDGQEQEIRRLETVKSGSVSFAPFERLGGSAQLTLDNEEIVWGSDRLKVIYDPGIPGVDPWPMGVYLFSSPKPSRSRTGQIVTNVDLSTKVIIVDEDSITKPLTVKKNALIIPRVVSLVESTGETNLAVTESDTRMRAPMTWEAGTSKLTVVNELLQAAGYWALHANREGALVIAPWVSPEDRDVTWEFEAGATAIHRANWSYERNLDGIPNRAVARTEGSEEQPALVGIAENNDPNSPFSIPSRGRVVTRLYEVEAATQKVVNDIAKRRLQDAQSPIGHWELEHAVLPLSGHDVVTFTSGDYSVRGTIQRIETPFGFDAHSRTIIREGGGLTDDYDS